MFRVFRRSLLEPVRSIGTALTLLGSMAVMWFTIAVFVILRATKAEYIPWLVGSLEPMIAAFLFVPVLILTLPIISGEARDRTLLLNLMEPISRADYYSGRVLGRAAFALGYFAMSLFGLYRLLLWLQGGISDIGESPLPPDLAATLIFIGLSLVTMVFSLSALAAVSSSRYGHAIYWAGLFAVVHQARDLHQDPTVSAFGKAASAVILELLQPAVIGPDPRFVAEAALGSWHLWRAVLQWGFGLALAYAVGVYAFSKMEVARRT